MSNDIVASSNSDLDVLFSSEYLDSVCEVSDAVVSKNFSWLFDDYDDYLDMVFWGSILGTMITSGASAALFAEGLIFLGSLVGVVFIFVLFSVLKFSLGRGSFPTLGLYSLNNNIEVSVPSLCSIDKELTDNGLLLKIVDNNRTILRSRFFGLEEEEKVFETIVEWENDIIDAHNENTEKIEAYKSNKVISVESKKEAEQLSNSVDKLLLNSNSRIASER